LSALQPNINKIILEPTTGIEPVNLILTKDALYQLSYMGPVLFGLFILLDSTTHLIFFGAGNGIRTRDPQLGRLTL
jgi:hypothetical protein